MLAKMYVALWFTVAFAAGLIFLTGTFTILTVVVFGFISFGLVFMGMMCVLPYEVSHAKPGKTNVPSEEGIQTKQDSFTVHARAFAAELLSADGIEIRKPKYH